ncbi:class I SAM-dependent methyltransferase [Ferrimicrobium sp.]|uniref:class I SAM-dependent methyltransferase n=1 Tax=Ferrimicrobium sp. TaxID=2926050 RepID=UPI00261BA70B|nr:class I SAM-dependent methyltransferase [Ferrimicrobium sp.]
MTRNELIAANLAWWDERAALHAGSAFYRVDELINGESALDSFEIEELPNEVGNSLLHLQCHIGTDTISWARRGFQVTGVDFSAPALAQARRIAQACGITATWSVSDVYNAPDVLGRQFDVVYTGKGALTWLDDLRSWAQVVNQLLNPGGYLYLVEFHPITWILPEDNWTIANDYFTDGQPYIETDPGGSYAAPDEVTHSNITAEWQHTVGEIISCIAGAGLTIEWFHEYDYTHFAQNSLLERSSNGRRYRLPRGMPRLPLLYSLRARKPG